MLGLRPTGSDGFDESQSSSAPARGAHHLERGLVHDDCIDEIDVAIVAPFGLDAFRRFHKEGAPGTGSLDHASRTRSSAFRRISILINHPRPPTMTGWLDVLPQRPPQAPERVGLGNRNSMSRPRKASSRGKSRAHARVD